MPPKSSTLQASDAQIGLASQENEGTIVSVDSKNSEKSAKSSVFAKGKLYTVPRVNLSTRAGITEWCLDQKILMHLLTTSDIPLPQGDSLHAGKIIDNWKTKLTKPMINIPDHILAKLKDKTLKTGGPIETGVKSQEEYEGFYRAAAIWGGEQKLTELAENISRNARWLAKLPPATCGNEAEWRTRIWDRIFVEMEEHLFQYRPTTPPGKYDKFNPNAIRYFQERSFQYPRSVAYDELRHPASDKSLKPYDSFLPIFEKHHEYLQKIQQHLKDSNDMVALEALKPILVNADVTAEALETAGLVSEKHPKAASGLKSEKLDSASVTRWQSYTLAMRQRLSKYPKTGIADAGFHWVSWKPWKMLSKEGWEDKDATTAIRKLQTLQTSAGGDSMHTPLVYPIFITEKKKNEESTLAQANNQRLLYCTAALRGLAALGIRDYPIYGLATYGSFGTIACAWYTEVKQQNQDPVGVVNYAFNDKSPDVTFNLLSPKDVMQLIIVVLAILLDDWAGGELHKKMVAIEEGFDQYITSQMQSSGPHGEDTKLDDAQVWTLKSQLSQYDVSTVAAKP